MRSIRNQSNIKKVLIRDLHICRACGMRGSEVHHIIPLIFNGRDEIDNMITLCSRCHKDAPNEPEEFEKFLEQGGTTIPYLFGKAIYDLESKGVPVQMAIPKAKEILRGMLYLDIKWALDNYKSLMKDSINIKDPNFKKLSREFSRNSSNSDQSETKDKGEIEQKSD
jgi:hypothetical protein